MLIPRLVGKQREPWTSPWDKNEVQDTKQKTGDPSFWLRALSFWIVITDFDFEELYSFQLKLLLNSVHERAMVDYVKAISD